jgi:hypothetical protein
MYVPFVALLTVALWNVSGSLSVHGSDANHFAFLTRVYRDDGLFFRHFNGEQAIVYPSAFGAMTAVTAALAPVSGVQAVNLQHIVWLVLGLFLITGAMAQLAGRPLWLLHSLALPFVAIFPLYSLFPFIVYQSPGRLTAPALLTALCLLPLLIPLTRRRDLVILLAVEALLAVLIVAINPACVPFLGLACPVALVILCWRGKASLGVFWPKTLGLQAVLTALAGLLILACDPYYSGLIRNLTVNSSQVQNLNAHAGVVLPAGVEPAFSWPRAVSALGKVRLLGLTPEKLTFPIYTHLTRLHGWQHKPPFVLAPWLALGLALTYLAWFWQCRKETGLPAGAGALAGFAAACLGLWVLLKLGMLGLAEGLSFQRGDTALLSSYVRLMLVRCELVLVAACLAASGVGFFLLAERLLQGTTLWGAARVAVPVLAWLPYAFLVLYDSRSGHAVMPSPPWAEITPDDLELVAWIDSHLSPADGLIGLAAHTFRVGRDKEEHHMYPIDGAQAVQLYGKQYNYCFTLNDPGRYFGPEAYNENVRDVFRGDWCLRNGIRYFYVSKSALAANPGLGEALARGRLKPVQIIGSSGVFEVQPGE